MTRGSELELILFATDPKLVGAALAAGIGSFIVDWEWRGKEERQVGADTEINRDRPEDLRRLEAMGVGRRYCRLNRWGPWTAEEIEVAIGSGATHLLLPMVEGPEEVELLLERVAGRSAAGILVETSTGVAAAPRLSRFPLSHVYVGLNDLAISRGSRHLFDAVADGTVESLRRSFDGRRFGFGGLTVVEGGDPVPCRLLLAEMARLGCGFSFLRRSFKRDVVGGDMSTEIARLHRAWEVLLARDGEEIAAERQALLEALGAVAGAPG